MKVLGISGLANSESFKKEQFPDLSPRFYRIRQGFDAAAALMIGNQIVACAAEERFNRIKNSSDFPIQSIQFCLKKANLLVEDLDYIAHGFDYEPYRPLFNYSSYSRRQFERVYSRQSQLALIEQHLSCRAGKKPAFVSVSHHRAHAASAFYLSGFPASLILVADGMGEVEGMTVAVGEGTTIRVIDRRPSVYSLGLLYSLVTLYLGFEFNRDEYKVMGLAAYGRGGCYLDALREMITLEPEGRFTLRLFEKNTTLFERENCIGSLNYLESLWGPARAPGSPVLPKHRDIAAAVQCVLESVLLHVLSFYREKTGLSCLCLAGGVALNCVANTAIKRRNLFDRIFIQPAAGDDGTALGAALETYYQCSSEKAVLQDASRLPYYGPAGCSMESRRLLSRQECRQYEVCRFQNFTELCQVVSEQLARGATVAWFQGSMEFGPRALGNRSILADARDPGMQAKLNRLIKQREAFRPFAPAVLSEYATQFFEIEPSEVQDYQTMQLVVKVRENYRASLPAITHVDGSARLQTVYREGNFRFWQLLHCFYQLTGVPVLINTSFNIKGEPIVCDVKGALDTFQRSGLDFLVVGHRLISLFKKESVVGGSGC